MMWSADAERVAILYRVIRDSLLIEREHLGKNVWGRESSKIKDSKVELPGCSGNSKDASVAGNDYVRRRELRKKGSER